MKRLSTIATLIVGLFLSINAINACATDLSKKPDPWFLTDEGRSALDCILSWQSVHGDWPKNTDTVKKPYNGDRSKIDGTFDNGATTGELRALSRGYKITGDERYKRAYLKGFDHILKAQYPNGGWPQYFPLRQGYYTHITFNDGCMIRLLEFLRDASNPKEADLLDQARREAAARAIERGIDCIVRCQVVVRGTPTVWCAQHDEVTLAPTSARNYELASLSGAESAGVLKYLMSLEKPSQEVVRAVKFGVAWFDAAKIRGIRVEKIDGDRKVILDESAAPVWARFYETETNRPFFCDRDGVPKYSLREIGSERRNGYAWYGSWGESVLEAFTKWPYR